MDKVKNLLREFIRTVILNERKENRKLSELKNGMIVRVFLNPKDPHYVSHKETRNFVKEEYATLVEVELKKYTLHFQGNLTGVFKLDFHNPDIMFVTYTK